MAKRSRKSKKKQSVENQPQRSESTDSSSEKSIQNMAEDEDIAGKTALEVEGASKADENAETLDNDGEAAGSFFQEDCIYELDAFILPGESYQQDISPFTFDRSTSPKSFSSPGMDDDELREKLKGRVNDNSDQEDTIPPEEAENPQIDHQLEMRQSGVFRIPNFSGTKADLPKEKPQEISPLEEKMLTELKLRKRKFSKDAIHDELIGTTLSGRYQILDLTGHSKNFSVYKVRRKSDSEIFAAKAGHVGIANEELEKLDCEIEALSKLKHKNIVRFEEVVEAENGRKFLITENIKGLSISDVLEIHGPLENVHVLGSIMEPICDALIYAHGEGVIHQDIRSGNIIVSRLDNKEISIKVLNFGITREAHGSPLYMTPEHCLKKPITVASDIYSLGILFYELLTGQPPYSENPIKEVRSCHTNSQIKPTTIAQDWLDIPLVAQIERIIFKALETNPDLRFDSVLELKFVLNDWIQRSLKI